MQPDTFYHIYNHANGFENLFREKENYRFFLEKWLMYIGPVAETHAYCLMPNHIHFLVRVYPEEVLVPTFRKLETFGKLGLEFCISKTFGNLFSSYTQSFNKKYKRKGSLFIPKFKRKEIDSEHYLTTIVHYIHHNPVHHGFCNHYEDWPHSSFHNFLSKEPGLIEKHYILKWFGGEEDFLSFHQTNRHLPETPIFADM